MDPFFIVDIICCFQTGLKAYLDLNAPNFSKKYFLRLTTFEAKIPLSTCCAKMKPMYQTSNKSPELILVVKNTNFWQITN